MQNPSLESILADDEFVRRIARRLVRDGPTADDIAQAAYVEALERCPSQPPTRGWLATVVRHLALNRHRSEQRRARHEEAASRPDEQAPESQLIEREEVRQRLVAAVLRLGAPRSTVVILRYFDDLPPRAIAKRLGMPVETVRTHLKRAHAELRARLGTERRSDGSSVFAALPLLLPAQKLGPVAIGVAVMTAKTKIALFLIAALVATLAWITTRERASDAPAVAQHVQAADAETPAVAANAALATPADPALERAPLVAQPTPTPTASPVAPVTGILRGVVLDPDGAPVAGASIDGAMSGSKNASTSEVSMLGLMMRPDLGTPPDGVRADGGFHARSRADGTFEVVGLPLRDSYDVAASTEQLGVVVVAGVPVRAVETAEITLRFLRGVVLRGTVTNEVGSPLAEARVQVMGTHDGKGYSSFLQIDAQQDGTWKTPPLARQAFQLMATAPGFRSEHRRVTWDPLREREIVADFHLVPVPIVRGRFVDDAGVPVRLSSALETRGFESRDPSVALFLSYEDPAKEPNFRGIGHSQGTIDWDEDRWQIALDDAAARFVSLWCGTTLLGVATPSAGAEVDLVVHLERLPRQPAKRAIVVRLVDAERKAVPAASARLNATLDVSDGGQNRTYRFVAGEEGRMSAENVPPGEYEMRVTAPGFVARRALLTVDDAPGPFETTMTLERASRTVTVVVRTSVGDPVAGAQLHALDSDGRPVDLAAEVRTNQEGRAELRLAAAEFTILAQAGKLAPAGRLVRADEQEVVLVCTEGIEVRVDVSGAFGPFSARVTDGAGVVLFEDACVDSRRYGAGIDLTLPPGRHTIVVRCPGFAPGEATVDVAPGLKVGMPLVALPR